MGDELLFWEIVFKGKVVFIMGGGLGIGLEIVI